ncbi:uncharacterized protein LOC131927693 [Physella acuta]|uniref:uncharacterized protein LOC131927693 n=1 Tax=Physella acuta TaxID=109671 RepID=UPI0027DDE320|nr:uncharacterized protein LOC131927693 [Physella acuta]
MDDLMDYNKFHVCFVILIGIGLFHQVQIAQCQEVSTSATIADDNETAVALPSDCWCVCDLTDNKVTDLERIKTIQRATEIRDNLLLDKESLSATKRKKYSVMDDRTYSQAVGYIGVVTLTLVFLTLVWMDASYIKHFARSLQFGGKGKEL